MSDESSGEHDADSVSPPFEDWLEQKAEEEGLSRKALFEQLISSHWTLNEMSRMLEETTGDDSLFREDAPKERDTEGDAAGGFDEDETVTDQFDRLRGRVDAIQTELEREVERSTELAAEIDVLANRLGSLEAELADAETLSASRISEFRDELESVESRLSSEREQLRTQVESEFDHVQTILEYLVEEMDELDARIAETRREHRKKVDRLLAEHDSLRRLKRAADNVGSAAGECENCGDEIDIALLGEPYCPGCGAELAGVERRTKWYVLSETVVTTAGSERPPRRTETRGARSGRRTRRDPSNPSAPASPDGSAAAAPRAGRERPAGSGAEPAEPNRESGNRNAASGNGGTGGASETDVALDLGDGTDATNTRSEELAGEDDPFGDIDVLTSDVLDSDVLTSDVLTSDVLASDGDSDDDDSVRDSDDDDLDGGFEWNRT